MKIDVLYQHPMPSHPRRSDTRAPLPDPGERARLRRAWQLTHEQVAAAFGVTAATVRSWESGRTTPTGLRRAAYAAFLSGLSQGLAPAGAHSEAPPAGADPDASPADADPEAPPAAVSAPRRAAVRRRCDPPSEGSRPPNRPRPPVEGARACPKPRPSAPVASAASAEAPRRIPVPTASPVEAGPDPVTPARRRRFRLLAAASGAWTLFLHLMITSPPPHL
ncbi:helix-turn-helix domain-containing protein [Streptomyces sp. NRRL B-3229]|uniref:helix-turn-helix domain-containing protein n=1 Tax=Streptomyces sp. NRRL B-3229 TaxID=1463836 RepID=UPI00131CEB8B|nr:helix-turn-helix domain-containing protein [Streptomyces sp. NRRL B-3229]